MIADKPARWRRVRQWAANHDQPVKVLSALCTYLLLVVTAMRQHAKDTMHQKVVHGVQQLVIRPFEDVKGHLSDEKILRILTEVPWQIFDHYGTVAPPMVKMLVGDGKTEGKILNPADSPELYNTDLAKGRETHELQYSEELSKWVPANDSENLYYRRKCPVAYFIKFLNTGRTQISNVMCPGCMHYKGGYVALLSISNKFCLAPFYPLLVDRLKNATLIDIDLVFAVVDRFTQQSKFGRSATENNTTLKNNRGTLVNQMKQEGGTCTQVSSVFQMMEENRSMMNKPLSIDSLDAALHRVNDTVAAHDPVMRVRLLFDKINGYNQWTVRLRLKLSVGAMTKTNEIELIVMWFLIFGVILIIGYSTIALRDHPGLQNLLRVFGLPVAVLVLALLFIILQQQMLVRHADLQESQRQWIIVRQHLQQEPAGEQVGEMTGIGNISKQAEKNHSNFNETVYGKKTKTIDWRAAAVVNVSSVYTDYEALQQYWDNMELLQVLALILMTGNMYSRLFSIHSNVQVMAATTLSVSLDLLVPVMLLEYLIYNAAATSEDLYSQSGTLVTVLLRTLLHTSAVGGVLGAWQRVTEDYGQGNLQR